MSEYPTVITEQCLNDNAAISDEEIRKDISDTLAEIEDYNRRIPTLMQLGDKLSCHHASGLQLRVEECERFVAFLRLLLETRLSKNGQQDTEATVNKQ